MHRHARPVHLARLLDVLVPPFCWHCGAVAAQGKPLCAECRGRFRWLGDEPADGAWAPVAYEGPARSLVAALKFRGAVGVTEAMAAQIVAGAPFGLLAGTTLVPVPLHPARRRARGFNQAERLAAAVAARTGLEVLECLGRSGTAGTQMGRPRAERLVAPDGAYFVRAGVCLPSRVTLIDDVITTGATLRACSSALRRAGARQVVALTYARTPTR